LFVLLKFNFVGFTLLLCEVGIQIMDLLTTMKEGSGWAQKEFLKVNLGRPMSWEVLKE
jgi:hypothetical protein